MVRNVHKLPLTYDGSDPQRVDIQVRQCCVDAVQACVEVDPNKQVRSGAVDDANPEAITLALSAMFPSTRDCDR